MRGQRRLLRKCEAGLNCQDHTAESSRRFDCSFHHVTSCHWVWYTQSSDMLSRSSPHVGRCIVSTGDSRIRSREVTCLG